MEASVGRVGSVEALESGARWRENGSEVEVEAGELKVDK